jgi:hypothetical protein
MHQYAVGLHTCLARTASRVGYGSQFCSRLRKPSEQVGEHSSGAGGCLACRGSGGICAGAGTLRGALGTEDVGALAQDASSAASAGSVSRGDADLVLGMALHLGVPGAPLRLGLAGLFDGRSQRKGGLRTRALAVGALGSERGLRLRVTALCIGAGQHQPEITGERCQQGRSPQRLTGQDHG